MKTFETEKHNIPEGATHYSNETQGAYFAWYKKVNHCNFLWCGDVAGKWEVMVNQEEFDEHDVKLIPKPRTKTEFVKCEFNHAWEAVKSFEDGEELFKTDSDELQIERFNSIALRAQAGYPFYRKVETEIDERREFIDAYALLRHKFHGQRTYDDFSGFMFDSGKFKLVE